MCSYQLRDTSYSVANCLSRLITHINRSFSRPPKEQKYCSCISQCLSIPLEHLTRRSIIQSFLLFDLYVPQIVSVILSAVDVYVTHL